MVLATEHAHGKIRPTGDIHAPRAVAVGDDGHNIHAQAPGFTLTQEILQGTTAA